MHQLQRRSIKKGKRCSAQLELDVPWALLFVARFSINSSPVPFFSLSHAFSHAPSLSLSSTPTHLTFSGGQTHTLTLAFFVFLRHTLTHSFNQKVCFSLSSFHTHILSHDSFLSADHTLTESPSSTLCHVSHYLSLFFFLSHSTDKNTLSLSLTKNVNQGPVRAWFMFCLWSWQAKNKLPILLCRSFKK